MSRKKPNPAAKPETIPTTTFPWARGEILAAIALSLWIVLLHVLFLCHAGPLWRDEVGTIDFASMPTLPDVWHNLQYDNFPPLFVAIARLWTMAGLSSDFACRWLGFLVGVTWLAILWFGARRGGTRAPLLVLALYAASPLAIRVGDAMRPYGLGIALNVLTLILTWQSVENPCLRTWLWATLAAVLSVQCLYQNSLFVAAYCLAGSAVCLAQRLWKMIAQTIGIGAVAALSLLPHLGNILKGQDWLGSARHPVQFSELAHFAAAAANDAGSGMVWFWTGLTILAVGVAAWFLFAPAKTTKSAKRIKQIAPPLPSPPSNREGMATSRHAYFAIVILATVPLYFLFLQRISLKPQSWYFLDLLAPVAVATDSILAGIEWVPAGLGRSALAVTLAVATVPACFAKVQVRQTNADLVAAALRQHAGPQDLILVSPWYYGVALQRYYTNHFDTIPPMAELRIHRYDLMKQAMLAENPIGPLLARVKQTLQSTNTFWVVGDFQFPPPGLPQPLLPPYVEDASMDVPAAHYFSSWMFQFSQMVQAHATSMGNLEIQVPGGAAVSGLENMPVYVFRGWKE
jgi:hypothetical protein